ncbi:hypothetical protein A2960_00225 [Candidatus Gottesmanbacteria bacterium RIFCSPLOWO2_01_FULL_39_12b]|uniref:Toxin HicA n=1 Tax=Candidatus Gottesmanbacteria bacterium RIFCSPLOWO2_01_FULL_39_12b TaxID=1798388 RepID=A0A1F6ART5_9BACT|nr:MAG: hypothetical protein A2960_00225 [Candidatus Gottesmanbacteria bacterium RIFCSPLOWO2_01_FULL_39_12b]
MSKLPSFKAREILEILFSNGFEKVRISGSHIRLRKGSVYVTVPFHTKDLPTGTLRNIIRQSQLPIDSFKK